MAAILRPKAAWQRLGIGRTGFYANYVQRPGGDEFVPGTKVRRLRPVQLGKVAVGFPDVEIDALVDGLREERDGVEGRRRTGRERDQGRFVKAHDREGI